MNEISYTQELNEIIDYASQVLYNEFPTLSIKIEHIMISILDHSESHAYIMMSNNLSSLSIMILKKNYEKFLSSHSVTKKMNQIQFSNELKDILNKAKEIAEAEASLKIGSEHLLNAIIESECYAKQELASLGFNKDNIFNTEKKQNKKPMTPDEIIRNITGLPDSVQIKMNGSNSSKTALNEFTTNITSFVSTDKYTPLIGREREMSLLIDTLARKTKNNAMILGNSGVGKTELVYGLAEKIVKGDVPEFLLNKEILSLDVVSLVCGTTYRGMFEQRIKSIFSELSKSKKYILFIDDMQQIVKTSGKEKDSDMSSVLGFILNDDDVRIIATMNFKDYKNGVETNQSISRKFHKIILEPNTMDEAYNIIMKLKNSYETYHHVLFSNEIIKYIMDIAQRFMGDKSVLEASLDIIDMCGASKANSIFKSTEFINLKKRYDEMSIKHDSMIYKCNFNDLESIKKEMDNIIHQMNDVKEKARNNVNEITKDVVNNVVSALTNIPISKLSSNEKENILNLNNRIKASVIGQDESIDVLCKSIKRNKVGLCNDKKPITVSLLLGPTGVGKSLLAKKIAEEVFGDENNMIRIDMSEFSEKSSISKLIGTSSGYIGYGEPNQLTDKVRNKPYCVILLDEIEKANEEVYNLLLQVFDEGRLTDGQGFTVSFKKTIILMTSNVGAKKSDDFGKGIGFISNEKDNRNKIITKELKNKFNPEFLNRIDSILYFNKLTNDNIRNIIKLELSYVNDNLKKNGLSIKINDDIINFIYDKAIKESSYGARPIKRIITSDIEDKIVDIVLENDYSNHEFICTNDNGNLVFK